ncbi:MAG: saccharopine dehydrogenase NADP-binding domain-containing protein [Candidatus Margulisbacteria bacterium]|nr:saccharopine dehydrogenase NADP-binding domain-containing protein [Candidatus Margulisiibacteriota bacterium]
MKIKFDGKILVIGCGGVSQCFLPLLVKHIDLPPRKITVIDFLDKTKYIPDILAQGVVFKQDRITKDNLAPKLAEYAGSGDLIIDLAWNIDCNDILQWCHDHNVRYINTSVEEWDPYADADNTPPAKRTLYYRQMELRAMLAGWAEPGPSAVIDHGANPGLVSHFVKVALGDIARQQLEEQPRGESAEQLQEYLRAENWARLSQTLGVKVIHISERDTQIINQPKQLNEFVNTWSIEGFYEESIAPAELGWGTHELALPPRAITHSHGPQNQICLAQMGLKTRVRSWVPCGEITGMVIRHGEAFSISDYLTVWNGPEPLYRPTVHYAYCPCDGAQLSIAELEMRQFKLHSAQRILTDEISSGRDELGVLLMGHAYKSWWTGSLLDIETARALAPHQNATTLQVACSVLGAVFWLIRNPRSGVKNPDQLPYQEVLEVAKPYLGQFVSIPADWDPTQNRRDIEMFNNFRPQPRVLDEKLMWQFNTFLVE